MSLLHPAKRLRLSHLQSTPRRRRHASAAFSTQPSPQKQRTWLRVTIVTAVAAAIGAYTRYEADSGTATLNPYTFTQYELVSKIPVSSSSSIFTLRPVKLGDNDTFLIRKDPYGEVSGYLHGLPVGAKLDLRGPRLDYILPADVQEILFIAGGTGIATGLQAVHALFRNNDGSDLKKKKKKMHILWANRRRDDCLGGVSDSSSRRPTTGSSSWWKWVFRTSNGAPEKRQIQRNDIEKSVTVQYLEELKAQYPGMLTVDYFVDEEGTLIGKDAILGFTEPERATRSPGGGTKLILISGPDGFISYLAGPKMWSGGKEIQGPLEGLIRQLDLKDWSVRKL
ncbi:conserved hypothetical protein [Histoplasma mississippiense (nom. inval.)]|uniref:conserved hypothetical protein n=1 Tax=Ajellomyces capsulatus (strain NAm1 / WU24) TaxID=2059318 RepID=UPI000157C9B1|nr:conserved hypothetical protein [Histoplasma mississippiense (nom. inval.)]EDN09690.1 conserved hypothetical protein [Histoplasma mississippiense (nom. inval.)]